MELYVLCTAASLPLIALVSHALQPLADARRGFLPGPRPLPVVGNLLDIAKEQPHRSLARLARQHCQLMSVRLGTVYAVVATSTEAAREVVQRRNASLAVARAAFAAVMGVLCQAMFSEDLDPALVDELTDVTVEASVLSGQPNISDFYPALAVADVQGVRRRAGKLVTWLYNLIDGQIERRRSRRAAEDDRRNDLLDLMLDMDGEVQEEGWVMNQDVMRGLFLELHLASSSLSATTEWAMAELLQSPRSMKKLQQEIASVVGTKPHLEESDLNQLPYLEAVINETLRLHPPVPFATGLAEAAVEVQGYNIPRGTTTFVNIWGICRDGDVWNDPEK